MRNYLLSLLLMVISGSLANAQKMRFYAVEDFSDYQQVLIEAREENKIIFTTIYQSGDAFATMSHDKVFSNDSLVSHYGKKAIPIAVDVSSDMGSRLVQSFGLNKTPAFLYLTQTEILVLVKEGYQSVEELNKNLITAYHNVNRFKELQEKFGREELTVSEWREYLELQSLNRTFEETRKLARYFFNSLDNARLLSPEVFPFLTTYGIDLESKYPEFILENKEKFSSDSAFENFYKSTYSYNFDRAAANGDTVLLQKITTVLLPHNPDTTITLADLAFETKKVFAAESNNFQIWEKAVLERAEVEKTDSLKARFIFNEAYNLADEFNTTGSQKAVRNLAKKANDLKPDFRFKLLEGYMAYLLKDYQDAGVLVNEAKSLTDNPNNLRKADSLLKMIDKEKP